MRMMQFAKSEIWTVSYWGAGHAAILRSEAINPNTVVPVFLGNLESRVLFSNITKRSIIRSWGNDLFLSLLKECNASLTEIEVFETREGSTTCQLNILHNGRKRSISTKPVDALPLMMHTGCELLVDRGFFRKHGIPFQQASALASQRLAQKLEEAVDSENYELAALIRDQMVQMY